MPIYEYRCAECDRVFEALQRVNDQPLDACRHCGGGASRIVSSPAIQFVGTGWYVTDYARKGSAKKDGTHEAGSREGGKESAGKDGAAGTASAKAGAATSEAKSAAAAS